MFVFKQKDFGNKYNRYRRSVTVNVRTEYGRHRLLYVNFKERIGTVQAVSHKQEHLEDIASEILQNKFRYRLSILLLFLTPVIFLLGLLHPIFLLLTLIPLVISIAFNKTVNEDLLYYEPVKYNYCADNYLEYSLIIKREDLIKKNKEDKEI